jgi:acyl-coenzyme A thioesterase PaaI-like protein
VQRYGPGVTIEDRNLSQCYGCGARNPIGLHLGPHSRVEGDELVMQLTMDWHFAGFPGVIHGGVVGTILDEAVEMHATEVLNLMAVTAQLNISYRAPVPIDQPISIHARGTREGSKIRSTADIRSADGTVLADAEAVLVIRAEEAAQV